MTYAPAAAAGPPVDAAADAPADAAAGAMIRAGLTRRQAWRSVGGLIRPGAASAD
jgi:hypothetical protein